MLPEHPSPCNSIPDVPPLPPVNANVMESTTIPLPVPPEHCEPRSNSGFCTNAAANLPENVHPCNTGNVKEGKNNTSPSFNNVEIGDADEVVGEEKGGEDNLAKDGLQWVKKIISINHPKNHDNLSTKIMNHMSRDMIWMENSPNLLNMLNREKILTIFQRMQSTLLSPICPWKKSRNNHSCSCSRTHCHQQNLSLSIK